TKEARVSLDFTGGNAEARLTRRFDGEKSHLLLETGGESFRGSAANSRLLELLWPQGSAAQEPDDALLRAMTHSVYLQQDLVREFIETEDAERFRTVSELVGAGV